MEYAIAIAISAAAMAGRRRVFGWLGEADPDELFWSSPAFMDGEGGGIHAAVVVFVAYLVSNSAGLR